MARITIEDVMNIAADNSGKCLSTEYVNESSPLKWKCAKGHIWKAPLHNVKYNNTWCPECAGTKRKSIVDAANLAKKNNGKCLSKKYVNNKQKLKWRCKCGHLFSMNFSSVSNGRWCPECAKERVKKAISLSLGDAQKVATKNGGVCLSEKYVNNKMKLEWECGYGHTWKARLHGVKNGNTWCPFCKKTSKNQALIGEILEELFGSVKYNHKNIKWLCNINGRKLEVDIYVPSKKLAVEYDGRQHFEPVDWAGKGKAWAGKELKKVKQRDKLKNSLINKHIRQKASDIKFFVRFNYQETINKKNIISKLIKIGVFNG